MGFLNPAAWALGILLGVLFLLYLHEQRRPRVGVPSLLLWQRVPQGSRRPSRFLPDPLFLLQLLILTLLLLGRADPYFGGQESPGAGRHVLILDTTASMQAREGRSTRFDQARAALLRRLRNLPAEDEIMLISAGHVPRIAAAFSRDRGALARVLAGLEPTDTGGALEPSLAIAERALRAGARLGRIEVFTDTPTDEVTTAWMEAAVFQQFGETDHNVAIETLQVVQGRFEDHSQARAQISIRNHSRGEAHGSLTASLDGRVIARRGFSLPPLGAQTFSLQGFPAPGILHADLDVADALSVDDRAYAWIRPVLPISILAFAEPGPFREDLERIAAATPVLQLRTASPSEYENMAQTEADLLLFERHVPADPPDRASLFVFPESGADWLAASGLAREVEVVDWNDRHPIFEGVRPEVPFPLRRVRLLEQPAWSETLLTTRANGRSVPLAFCGELGGKRIVALAVDLSVDRLLQSDHVNLLLLFLNTLDWLAPYEESVTVVRTGETRFLSHLPDEVRSVVDPRNRVETIPPGGPLRIEPLWQGEYRLQVNGTERRLFANLFDPRESDIGRSGRQRSEPASGQQMPPAASEEGPPRGVPERGIGLWLYQIAAALLVIEWIASTRNRRP
jgi:hypothetical protein